MQKNYKLTISVITMNRAEQLIEALESCAACVLPKETEILVFDNASTDDTKKCVETFAKTHSELDVNYHFSETNLGAGGGRSAAFELAKGDIIYFLDDDAVISDESKNDFFVKSLKLFEENKEIASLTTNIYDELLKYDRLARISKKKVAGLHIVFCMFGGSHFLRKEYFDSPLYFKINYGGEEMYPSIRAQDKGYFNAFDKELTVIHKPKVNKWANGTENMRYVLVNGTANIYAMKKLMYPIIARPLIWFGYMSRCVIHLRHYPGAVKEANQLVKKIVNENKGMKKIKFSTAVKFLKQYGLQAF